MAKKEGKDSFLTKRQLKQALTRFGADQERRLNDRLQAITNQVNLSLSGSKSLLRDHAIRINALTDFVFSNVSELSIMLEKACEKIDKDPDTDESVAELRQAVHDKITELQSELKLYQDVARKRMTEMVEKARASIEPAKEPEPAVRQIDLSDELPMGESLEMGSEKE